MKSPSMLATLADDFEFDQGSALFEEVEAACGGVGEVNNAVAVKGAVVVDGDANGFAVAEIGDLKFCAAGKFCVRGGEFFRGVGAAAGSFVSFE